MKRPTSSDVARVAGVSRATVSYVLNGRDVMITAATRARVREAVAQLGYHADAPARQMAGAPSQTLGFVVRLSAAQATVDGLLPALLAGVSEAARQADHQVLFELPGEAATYADLLRTRRIDGLIISVPRDDDVELGALLDEGFPIVIQGSIPSIAAPSVDIDTKASARLAVEHLLELGHRRIACITNASLAFTSASERLAGYREALVGAGIEPDPDLEIAGDFDAASGQAAVQRLLARDRPWTGLFVAADVVAFGALAGLRAAGLRVPQDMAVVGFDDSPLSGFSDPPLTTVRVPGYDLGRRASSVLLDRMAGRPVPQRTTLPTRLVVRATTGPPRHPRSRPVQEA